MTAARSLRLFLPDPLDQPGQTGQPDQPEEVRRLGDVYDLLAAQYPLTMSKRSRVEQRTALKHWRKATGDPDITQVTRDTIVRLRDYLIGQELSGATVNKIWRTLRAIFRYGHDELKWIDTIPSVAYGMRSRLVDSADPPQRELLSHAEIEQMWNNCLLARWPTVEPCLAWRTFLVLQWTYGMRTLDLIELQRSAVLRNSRLIRWAAQKTSKLQGLPLLTMAEWYLERWLRVAPPGPRLFEGFTRAGHVDHSTGKTHPGYYTVWNQVISAGIEPRVLIKNLRQCMVTELNDTGHGDDIGSWAAGHSPVGVTKRNYELPTRRVRKAFEDRPVPPCFLWGMRDAGGSRHPD